MPSASPTVRRSLADPRERAPAQLLVDALALVEQLVRERGGLVHRGHHLGRVEVVGERLACGRHELLGLRHDRPPPSASASANGSSFCSVM